MSVRRFSKRLFILSALVTVAISAHIGLMQADTTESQPEPAKIAYGQTVQGEVTEDQDSVWSFEGEAGEAVTLTITSDADTALTLRDPSGWELAADDDSGDGSNPILVAVELPTSGVYAIAVRSVGGDAGPFTLLMEKAVVQPPRPIDYGQTVTGAMTEMQPDRYTFTGKQGDIVRITLTADYDNRLELYDSNKAVLIQDDDSGGSGNAFVAGFPLPEDGNYTIYVMAYDISAATDAPYTLTFDKITVPTPGKIAIGTAVTTVMLTADSDRWTFEGKAGNQVSIAAIGTMLPMLEVYGPDQTLIASKDHELGENAALIDSLTLPGDGEYAIVVGRYGTNPGQYTLMLGKVAEPSGR